MEIRLVSARSKGKEKKNPENNIINSERKEELTKYLIVQIKEYENANLQDIVMWEIFQEDFGGWTMEDFSLCPRTKLENLKELLR